MISVEVVILAKSIKHKQYCVAGKCVANGVWVRPVASKDGAELQKSNVLISNNYGQFEAKPLQKVIMNFVQHAPLIFQPENFVVDGEPWRQNYKINLFQRFQFQDLIHTARTEFMIRIFFWEQLKAERPNYLK